MLNRTKLLALFIGSGIVAVAVWVLFVPGPQVETVETIMPPEAPILNSPDNGASTSWYEMHFKWVKGLNAENYCLVIDNDPNFADGENMVDIITAENHYWAQNVLSWGFGTFYWKVAAINQYGENWSNTRVFTFGELIDPATTNPGDVWFFPKGGIAWGDTFSTEVHVNSGTSRLSAYQFTIIYDNAVLNVDASRGENGVEAAPDGFVTEVNVSVPGQITVSGSNISGTGPGEDLHVLTIYWTTGAGTTTLGLAVDNLADETGATIGTPRGINGTVSAGID